MRITRVTRNNHGELNVHCRLESVRFVVQIRSDEFSVAELEAEIARKLQCEFGFRRAKSMVGRSLPLEEILRQGQLRGLRDRFWDIF